MCVYRHTHSRMHSNNMNESYKHYINEKLKNTLFHLYEVQNIAKPKINCIGILTYLKKIWKKARD